MQFRSWKPWNVLSVFVEYPIGTAEEVLFNITQINITMENKVIFSKQIDRGLLNNGSAPNSSDSESTYEVIHTGHGAPERMGEVKYFGGRVWTLLYILWVLLIFSFSEFQKRGWIDCYDPPMYVPHFVLVSILSPNTRCTVLSVYEFQANRTCKRYIFRNR